MITEKVKYYFVVSGLNANTHKKKSLFAVCASTSKCLRFPVKAVPLLFPQPSFTIDCPPTPQQVPGAPSLVISGPRSRMKNQACADFLNKLWFFNIQGLCPPVNMAQNLTC